MSDHPAAPPQADDKYFTLAGSGPQRQIFPGVCLRTTCGERMMLSVVSLEANSKVLEHAHPHEQVGYLVSGCLDFTVGDETRRLHPGDQWCIPGGVKHSVVAVGGPAVALDIFNPIREDYR